jgi:hypothetical protein
MLIDLPHIDSLELNGEIYKCQHIFRSLGIQFTFGMGEHSKIPLPIISPLVFSSASRKVLNFLDLPSSKIMGPVQSLFDKIPSYRVKERWEKRPMHSEFNLAQIMAAESVAHNLRHQAILELDMEKRRNICAASIEIYEFALLCCQHDGVANMLCSIRSSTKEKCSLISPVVDLQCIEPVKRRLISHCFAGMAVCALTGLRSPVRFFVLTSAALSFDAEHVLESAALLRLWLLMVGIYELKLQSGPAQRTGSYWKFSPDTHEKQLELMGALPCSTMHTLPIVYNSMTQLIILPLVLRRGTAEMVGQERLLILDAEWEKAHARAVAINQRLIDRASGAIPTPKVVTRTHIVGHQVAERVCGNCGKWQQEGDKLFARCSACMLVYYCSKECQTSDWKAKHRSLCIKNQ